MYFVFDNILFFNFCDPIGFAKYLNDFNLLNSLKHKLQIGQWKKKRRLVTGIRRDTDIEYLELITTLFGAG